MKPLEEKYERSHVDEQFFMMGNGEERIMKDTM